MSVSVTVPELTLILAFSSASMALLSVDLIPHLAQRLQFGSNAPNLNVVTIVLQSVEATPLHNLLN